MANNFSIIALADQSLDLLYEWREDTLIEGCDVQHITLITISAWLQ